MWSKLLIILLLVQYLSASCDICQSGKAACHSENTYSICIDEVPTRSDITCPVGYTCTGEKFICYKKADGYKPICSTPESSTAKSTTPESSTPQNTSPQNTTPQSTTPGSTTPQSTTPQSTTPQSTTPQSTTLQSTTPQSTTPQSTTPQSTTPQSTTPQSTTTESSPPESTTEDTEFRNFCTINGDGSFKNENDSTCKTFIWCYSGMGMIKKCEKVNSKETWFNGKDKCVLEKPENCT